MTMNGDTDITLNGKPVTLKCTPRALRDLDGMAGSFNDILNGLVSFRFSTYCAVVGAGLGKRPNMVEDDVFASGLDNLVGPLTEYVGRLMRGGREAPTEEEKATGEA